ncbi:tyrosine-protein phosphatase [Pseudaeromonas sp. ZJS20]|uniref:tyrosine-protein phosphatase n=1 Tax=Pseudaeromonas aegiceratis TaxID=3153928 RepID=UPI00390C945B
MFKSLFKGGLLCLLALALCSCNDSDSTTNTSSSDVPVTLSDTVTARTFALSSDASQVIFVFDAASQSDALDAQGITDSSTISAVEVRGSFNGWSSDGALPLTASQTDSGVWYLATDADALDIPGNSGHPEYKFVVTVDDETHWLDLSSTVPDGYHFLGNHILVGADDDLDTIIANEAQANDIKTLADFDLTTSEGQQTLANFRRAADGLQLFRSYHPYKQSRPALETEAPRLAYVNSLMEANGIGSVITLSGDETASLDSSLGESIGDYMQAIIDKGDNLTLELGYNLVYYKSDSSEFGLAIQTIVSFIDDDAHPGPYLVHCRLGTDRTGVITAMLSGLAGTDWQTIAADYQASNNMGIGEFRDYGLLEYSLRNMLGVDPADSDLDLQAALTEYFVSNGYLTEAQISTLQQKLKAG